jgi:hypothetical protein
VLSHGGDDEVPFSLEADHPLPYRLRPSSTASGPALATGRARPSQVSPPQETPPTADQADGLLALDVPDRRLCLRTFIGGGACPGLVGRRPGRELEEWHRPRDA